MNITNLLYNIKNIASQVRTIRSVYDGDVYTIWNTGQIKYASFVVGVTSVIRRNNTRQYNLIMYYGDRLMNNSSNKNAIWDDATNTLQTIVNSIQEQLEGSVEDYTIQLFEQKFEDMLAGGYVNISIATEDELGDCEINDLIIPEDELIERLKQEIVRLEEEIEVMSEKDAQLAILLKDVYYRLTGTVLQ